MASQQKKSALFVCLGNICRSPIAEAVFCHVLKERGLQDKWHVDSAGTGDWHVGHSPDKRAQTCMKKHGIDMNHKARVVTKSDYSTFDYIFGMDDMNISDLKEIAPTGAKAKIELLGDYDPKGERIIEDPYYESGDAGFEKAYNQCLRSSNAFLDKNG